MQQPSMPTRPPSYGYAQGGPSFSWPGHVNSMQPPFHFPSFATGPGQAPPAGSLPMPALMPPMQHQAWPSMPFPQNPQAHLAPSMLNAAGASPFVLDPRFLPPQRPFPSPAISAHTLSLGAGQPCSSANDSAGPMDLPMSENQTITGKHASMQAPHAHRRGSGSEYGSSGRAPYAGPPQTSTAQQNWAITGFRPGFQTPTANFGSPVTPMPYGNLPPPCADPHAMPPCNPGLQASHCSSSAFTHHAMRAPMGAAPGAFCVPPPAPSHAPQQQLPSMAMPPPSSSQQAEPVAGSMRAKLGLSTYEAVRSLMLRQQAKYVQQLFELHKLTQVQKLLQSEMQAQQEEEPETEAPEGTSPAADYQQQQHNASDKQESGACRADAQAGIPPRKTQKTVHRGAPGTSSSCPRQHPASMEPGHARTQHVASLEAKVRLQHPANMEHAAGSGLPQPMKPQHPANMEHPPCKQHTREHKPAMQHPANQNQEHQAALQRLSFTLNSLPNLPKAMRDIAAAVGNALEQRPGSTPRSAPRVPSPPTAGMVCPVAVHLVPCEDRNRSTTPSSAASPEPVQQEKPDAKVSPRGEETSQRTLSLSPPAELRDLVGSSWRYQTSPRSGIEESQLRQDASSEGTGSPAVASPAATTSASVETPAAAGPMRTEPAHVSAVVPLPMGTSSRRPSQTDLQALWFAHHFPQAAATSASRGSPYRDSAAVAVARPLAAIPAVVPVRVPTISEVLQSVEQVPQGPHKKRAKYFQEPSLTAPSCNPEFEPLLFCTEHSSGTAVSRGFATAKAASEGVHHPRATKHTGKQGSSRSTMSKACFGASAPDASLGVEGAAAGILLSLSALA